MVKSHNNPNGVEAVSRLAERLNSVGDLPSSTTSNTTAAATKADDPSAPTVETPYANRSTILDHTHAANRSVVLGQMAPAAESSRSAASRLRANLDDASVQEPGSRMSVRRAAGQRAESESTASMRRNNRQLARQVSSFSTDKEGDAISSAPSKSSGDSRSQGSRAPFASVRRIFRSRSKSQAAPPRTTIGSDSARTIPEAEETVKAENDTEEGATSESVTLPISPTSPSTNAPAVSHQRRSRDSSHKHNSFFLGFGRAKTPPRSKVDLEGVEAEAQRAAAMGRNVQQPQPVSQPQQYERNVSRAGEALEAGESDGQETLSPYGTPRARTAQLSGLPPTSSDGPPRLLGSAKATKNDRSLTLQSLTQSSPYSTKRSSLTASPAAPPKRLAADIVQPLSGRGSRAAETPTPTNAQVQRSRSQNDDAKSRSATSPTMSTPPHAAVPRIWQASRNSRSSLVDDSPVHDTMGKQRYGSSTTSGSASSFRTAPTFPDTFNPESLGTRSDLSHQPNGNTFESGRTISRAATSPLADLIENLEQRISSSSSPRSDPSTPVGDRSTALGKPAYAMAPKDAVRFPSTDEAVKNGIREEIEFEDESSFSQVSVNSDGRQSPGVGKRNTFGGDDMFDMVNRETTARASMPDTFQQEEAMQSRRDVSVQEIETSLAAVEAALHDHRVAGSLDPNPLRHHILSPRNPGNLSTASLSAYNNSFVGLDDDSPQEAMPSDEQEHLARITLPPEQQHAIADAVRQVRKAISSSQLPQIPNEEDSDVSRSPLAAEGISRPEDRVSNNLLSSSAGLSNKGSAPPVPLAAQPAYVLQRQRSANSRESTPMRAARVRQESMQDVEQAYARMVDLVSSAAGLDLTPSPMPTARFFARRPTHSQPTPPPPLSSYEPRSSASSYVSVSSPLQQRYVRERTQSAAPTPTYQPALSGQVRPLMPPAPPLPPIAATSSRSARQQLLRESDALSRFMGPLPDLSEETSDQALGLRGRTSNVSLGSRGSRRAASESPPRYYQRDTSHVHDQRRAKPQETANVNKRSSADVHGPSSSAAGSGGGASGTSPSVTIKTQGTPRIADADQDVMAAAAAAGVAAASAAIHASHHRSNSQQLQDWQTRSRFSSPSSTRLQQGQQSKRTSAGSNDSSAAMRSMALSGSEQQRRQIEEHAQRRMRAHMSGTSAGGAASQSGGNHSPGFGSAAGSFQPDSVTGSYRRSGSIRDWGRLEDLSGSMLRPTSGASGSHGAYGSFSRSHLIRGAEGGSDASDAARLALLNGQISSPTTSLVAVQRRHALERDSLLDMLDRTRTEAMDMRTRNEQLQADLHLEVTRVLELEREMQRQREREEQLAARVQTLEEELKAEQADRVRIGELLERVQRAVDDAANARNAPRHIDDELGSEDSEDETMEVVEGLDGEGEHMDDMRKRGTAASPTSSSMSILQEDLLPVKRRVFDEARVEDEVHLSGSSSSHVLRAMQPSDADPSHTATGSIDMLDVNGSQLGGHRERSPSLHSYPSALGLEVNDQELRWNLDEESPPETAHGTSPSEIEETLRPSHDEDEDDESVQDASQDFDSSSAAAHSRLDSSEDGSFRGMQRPSVLSKRTSVQSQSSGSRLPVLSKIAAGTAKATSGTSSLVPSASPSSIEAKWRYPTPNAVNARTNLAERLGGSMLARRQGEAIGTRVPGNGSLNSSPSLSPRSARYVSQGSRTTDGDAPHAEQTISPTGSFVSSFPTMTSGIRRPSSNRSGAPAFGANNVAGFQSPDSPSNRRLHAGATPSAKTSAGAAVHNTSGFYDSRRLSGYHPVDLSFSDAQRGEDGSSRGH